MNVIVYTMISGTLCGYNIQREREGISKCYRGEEGCSVIFLCNKTNLIEKKRFSVILKLRRARLVRKICGKEGCCLKCMRGVPECSYIT